MKMKSVDNDNRLNGYSKRRSANMKNRETVREVKSIKVIKEIIDQVDEEYKEEVIEFYSTKGKENKYQNINKFCKKVKLTEQSCNERS